MLFTFGVLPTVFAGTFEGNQLYVAPNGNDSVSRTNNDINSPWRTVEKAVELAQAGDVVNYRAGTYTLTTNIDPFGSIGNDGTASNRIVHTNYMNESVQVNDGGFRFFINHDYWTFSGIDFASSGRFLTLNDTQKGNHIVFENGTYTQSTFGGGANNAPIVMVGGGSGSGDSSNIIIRNNRFVGPGFSGNPNTACVMIFGARGVKIYNNEMSDSPYTVYYKHPGARFDTGIEIYNNYFRNSERGIGSAYIFANIHDNLSVNSGLSIGVASGYTPDSGTDEHGGDNNTVNHNTFYNDGIALVYEGDLVEKNIVKNNIFGGVSAIYKWDSGLSHNTSMANNLYPPGNILRNEGVLYTLSGWKTHYGQDSNSLSGNPTYVGGSSPSSILGYELASGSLGKNAASDGTDMGANISLVGLGLTRPKPPSAPNGKPVIAPTLLLLDD